MSPLSNVQGLEGRTLILAPTAGDGRVLAATLDRAGIDHFPCRDIPHLCLELARGAGAAVLAEECLSSDPVRQLQDILAVSPPWSELPILVMVRRGASAHASARILSAFENVARVTLLERPVSTLTLTSAVRAAHASRRHQYRVRDTIEKLESTEAALRESEARFRLALESGPVIVFGMDEDLRYTWIAHPDADLGDQQVIGRTDEEILGPEQGGPLMAIKRRVLETGEGDRVEHAIRMKRGWTAWDLSLEPLRDEEGEVVGLSGVTVEITDRKRAEREHERAEAFLRAAVEGSGIGVFEYDPAANRLDATERSWQIVTGETGIFSSGIERWTSAIHPEDRAAAQSAWRRALAPEGEGRYEADFRVVHADGSTRWVAALGQTRFGEESGALRATELVGTVQDVTEERATETRLRELTEMLEQLVVARTEKLEQRTGQLRRLANQLVFTEQRERARLAKMLHDHLQQILAAAKIQVDLVHESCRQPELDSELTSARELLREAVEASRSLAMELSPPALQSGPLSEALKWQAKWMESHHKLQTDIRVEGPLPEVSHEAKILLFEAMRELLFNAVKHAEVDRCSVRLHTESSRVCLTVEDRGKGFDPENVTATGAEGFGISSIRERLEAMGASMEVESAPGKGSTFRLLVPASSRREAERPQAGREPARDDSAPATDKKIRLLVVDDHPIVRDGLVSMIRRSSDMEVVGEASDGEEAIDLAELLKPDLVVMDINMPKLDGLQATREIKRRQPEIRIVGLSIQGEEAAAAEMARAGASAFLPKGGQSEVFFDTLRRVMSS